KRSRDVAFAGWLRGQPSCGEVADAVERCGSLVMLRYYWKLEETRIRGVYPSFCRKRFLCSMCDYLRACKTLCKYVERVLFIVRQRQLKPYMVTFTVKDGEELRERVNH